MPGKSQDQLDQELVEHAFFASLLREDYTVAPATVAQVAAELSPDALQAIVVGSRRLTDVLRSIELEAARQARAGGTTVRQLAALTGISERRANDRYRREARDAH